ncbi:sensor histidine kinase [Modestobacter sp. VKM Ac-2985]|uniref:sensor histidine kinase n=1 Tax=Modestobacter sp. VKM Ac-2985 TaxID=3004139 RepID=UPI0022AB6DA8|nr:histidine kinase [Modestobacter sp. VKM Ac-2985]MCZ2836912.1 histidine kinase [Modestobacter sp. VKM Ac-2985]
MHAPLSSLWNEPRPPDPPDRAWPDWVLVALAASSAVLEGVLRPDLPFRWLQVAVLCALVPLLAWRRARPLLVLAVVLGCLHLLAVLTGDDEGLYSAAVTLVLPYALLRWGSGREALDGLVVLLGSAASSAVVGSASPGDALGGAAVLLSSLALGAAARYRARARARELDQVAAREREDLARDLHDTVAHHVSAIAIRAQAGLATSAARPDAATEALRLIEAEAARTLTEMRSMVRVLRHDEPATLSPTPGLPDLQALAWRGPDGPDVAVQVVGEVTGVSPSVATAVHRLAQESITNARRHARCATRVDVRVVVDGAWVRLRVDDDGEGGPAHAGGTGFGLRGMAERVHLLGGTFEAGPGPERGWTVAATLPRRGPA